MIDILHPKECDISIIFSFRRYDFSEPQFGKDVCDRIISPLKGALRRYCDEGHDILTASDMYQALQARQVKGTTAVVCEIDRSQSIKVDRISNFSAFHNFSYAADGVRISKAYEIGPGKLIPWSQLNVQGQGLIYVNEVSEQGFFAVTPRRMKLSVGEIQDSEKEAALFESKGLAVPTFLQRLKSCKIIFTLEDTFRVFERITKACTIDYAETRHSSSQRCPLIPDRNCRHPSNFQTLLVVFANSRPADGPCRSQVEVGQGLARKSSLTSQHDLMLARKQAGNQIPLRSQRT